MTTSSPLKFVPDDFDVPQTVEFATFRLEVLGPEHNERDYASWTSSMDHIRRTPGFENHSWPHPMTLAENLDDMHMHADEFAERTSFTWSILASDTDNVIGCIYLYPLTPPQAGQGRFRSWVSAGYAATDIEIRDTLRSWFQTSWPIDVHDWQSPPPG